ncbi:MAG: LamG domain-containing protein, partial [Gammaproteobacteria bacterium]|nr:LamG domain-containing protein [Gammaproteobacteria bacterium]
LMTLYKDGDFVVSEVKNGAIDNIAEAAIWIGDNPPGGERSFDGLIDELRIYDRALSEQEIQQIMISPL